MDGNKDCFLTSEAAFFWKEKIFWSDGYFYCSIENASIDAVRRKYIES